MKIKSIFDFIIEYLMTIVSVLGVAFICWALEPDDTLKTATVFWIVLPLAMLSLYLIKLVIEYKRRSKSFSVYLPRLRTVVQKKYLFEPSPIFSPQTFSSLYLSDEHEELVAIGCVESVLDGNGTLQVVIWDLCNGYTEGKILDLKNRIILKPTIPWQDGIEISLLKGEGDE